MNKYIALFFAFAFWAGSIWAAKSTDFDSKKWYTAPTEKWWTPEISATVSLTDSRGGIKDVDFSIAVDENGNISNSSLEYALSDIKLSINSLVSIVDWELCNIAKNVIDIARLDAQFETLGENLTKVLMVDGMSFKVNGKTYTLKMNKSTLSSAIKSGSTIEYEDVDGLFSAGDADERTINLTQDEQKLQLMNADRVVISSLTPLADSENNSKVIGIPALYNGGLIWFKWGGLCDKNFSIDTEGRIALKGWSGGNECGTSISEMLTEEDGANRANHYVLSRFGEGDEATFHYVPMGGRLEGLTAAADDESITSDIENGAMESNTLSLAGWSTADLGAIPTRGMSKLKWRTLEDMVDDKSIGVVEGLIPGDEDKKFEIKGASQVKSELRYFGTPKGSDAIGWYKLPDLNLNLTGTDGSTACATNSITFATAEDSDVRVTVEDNGNGNVTLRFGVYYK